MNMDMRMMGIDAAFLISFALAVCFCGLLACMFTQDGYVDEFRVCNCTIKIKTLNGGM